MLFDETYREPARLRDGTEVVIRTVRPEDKALLRDGFERLSPEGRYLRFHGVKTELTDAELRYLTEVDGVRHVAVGAVRIDGDGEHGLGIGRLVQLSHEPGVAEAAITVLDEVQGKGLGTLLFQRLIAAAAERGVERIRCLVLGSNHAMQEMLRGLATDSVVRVESGVVTIDIPLRDRGLYELLKLAAKKIIELRGPDADDPRPAG